MKYALLIITALLVVFVACKKKQERKNCYACTTNDSVVSLKHPELNNPHYKTGSGRHCEYTDDMKNYAIKQATYTDTLLHIGDTVELDFHTMQCEIE